MTSTEALPEAAPPSVPSGTVTFLFTDIEGSTRLLEQLHVQYAEVLADQRELLRTAFAHHDGHEIDTRGDAFFVAFAGALQAVACAVEAQRALASHTWPHDASVRVRMGLHPGEPLLARTGYFGLDVHRAARIAAAGHGGQVLLSQATRELVYQDLPAGLALRPLGEHHLKDIRLPQTLFQLDIDGLPNEFPSLKTLNTDDEPPIPGEPPFKGLLYFSEQDFGRFFGREAVTVRLAERVHAERFLALIGASGSGKSSLVRAGLVPALRRGGHGAAWHICLLTPTAHPLEALATSLTRQQASMAATAQLLDDLRRDSRSLRLWVQRQLEREQRGHQPGPEPRMLLVVDQSEELFTICHDEAERRQFIDNLLSAAQVEGGGLSLVMTLRADFYAQLAAHPALADAVAHHQEYLKAMSADELRQAIEGPARAAHWAFSPGLVDMMLHDIGAVEGRQPEPGALPLLSHALLETWQRRRGNVMSLKAYSEAGGVRGAIARSADKVFSQELSPAQQAIARNIFLRLTELGEGTPDTRRRVSVDELVPAGETDLAQVAAVLEKLATARLITAGDGAVEVAHEALIREWPTLREWLNEDREGLRTQRHLTRATQQWQTLSHDPGELYRGARLAQTVEWANLHWRELNAQEQEFLSASQTLAGQEMEEHEAQRQRELEAARRLVKAEQLRAEDQARHLIHLRARNRSITVLGAVAVLAALIAALLGGSANQTAQSNATLAAQSGAIALTAQAANTQESAQRATADAASILARANAATAEAERGRAEVESHQANSRELAIAALLNLSFDPERSVLLALHGLSAAYTAEAESALHSALQASRVVLSFPGPAWGIAYSPNGLRLAIGGDVTVRVLSTTDGQEVLKFPVPPGAICPVFSPDGKHLVTIGHTDNTVRIWDALSGQAVLTLSNTSSVQAVAFSPDGQLLATGGIDHIARVWDAASGALLYTITDHTDIVSGVAFSPDGKRLITGSWDLTLKVRDAANGQVLFTPSGDAAFGGLYSPDGTRFVTGSSDGSTVRMWDAATGQELFAIGLDSLAGYYAFSPDGQHLLTSNHSLELRDAKSGAAMLSLPQPGSLNDLKFGPDGNHIAAAASDGWVRVWDITPQGAREWLTLARHAGPVRRVVYSPNGKLLATASFDGTAKVFDAATGNELRTLAGHTDRVYGVAFSPDGARLATSSSDRTVKVWDAATGRELLTLSKGGHGNGVVGGLHTGILAVEFSADGTRLASAGADGTAVIWDATTGRALLTLSSAGIGLTSLAFSPDGTRLVTGSDLNPPFDNGAIVTMWDLRTGQEHFRLAQSQRVWSLAFNPDGTRFAMGAEDGALSVRDADTGQNVLSLPGHAANISSLVYDPNGRRIATGSADGTLKIWDSVTGQEQLTLTSSAGPFGVALSPDGTRLAAGNRDGTVRVYLLRIEDLVALAKTRVTRELTLAECQRFLHASVCPSP